MLKSTDHNHSEDSGQLAAKKIGFTIKEMASSCSDNPHVIIAKCTANISKSASVRLLTIRAMKRKIRDRRQKENTYHPLSISLESLKVPEMYSITKKNENFIIFDSGPAKDRILIFGTSKNLEYLSASSDWYADGTFKVTPPLFEQVYTIHALSFGKVFPAILLYYQTKRKKPIYAC